MNEADEDTEKPHEASQRKLEESRRKGELPRSADVNTAASYVGWLIVILAFTSSSLSQAGSIFSNIIGNSDIFASHWFGGSASSLSADLMRETATAFAVWVILPFTFVVVAVITQKALVFAPEKIKPKLSKISIKSGLKNKFGISGLFEFIKSSAKLTIYSIFLFFFLYRNLDELVTLVNREPEGAVRAIYELTIEFLIIVVLVSVALAGVDYVFQINQHQKKNRMSRREVTEESKQSEGDPHLKQERRQRGYEIASNRSLEKVPDADVVIVNPTHYAVALKWTKSPGSAPHCVAKGVDEIAARIREIAIENAIPIHSDPPTARALFATVDVDQEVLPEQYQAVAAAIRFAERVRSKVAHE